MEPKQSLNSQVNSKQNEHRGRHHTTGLQTILQGHNNQKRMEMVQKHTHRPMEQNREPRKKATHLQAADLWQSWQNKQCGKDFHSLNDVGITG